MPDVAIEKQVTLDLIEQKKPGTSVTSDMPIVETHPDSKPKPEAAPAKAETKEESAPSETTVDTTAAPDKKPSGVQKRIDELTRQREDERRARERAEERTERALALLEKAMKGQSADVAPSDEADPEPKEPDVAGYTDQSKYNEDYKGYLRNLARWEGRQEVRKSEAKRTEETQKREREEGSKRTLEGYKERAVKARDKYQDYDAVVNNRDLPITADMSRAIVQSEYGPDVAYFLGTNPEEAQRISRLSPEGQIMELGYLTAQFRQAAKSETTAQVRPSSAPKPITPIRTAATAATTIGNLEESMEAYAARRQKELNAERRPGGRR